MPQNGETRVRVKNIFDTMGSSGKAGCGLGFGMDSESCGYLGETPHNLNMCHHPGTGQILTTTDAHAFPLVGAYRREVEKVKWIEGTFNAASLRIEERTTSLFRSLWIFYN